MVKQIGSETPYKHRRVEDILRETKGMFWGFAPTRVNQDKFPTTMNVFTPVVYSEFVLKVDDFGHRPRLK